MGSRVSLLYRERPGQRAPHFSGKPVSKAGDPEADVPGIKPLGGTVALFQKDRPAAGHVEHHHFTAKNAENAERRESRER